MASKFSKTGESDFPNDQNGKLSAAQMDSLLDAQMQAAIGRDIRALRQGRQVTLSALALKMGRSVGYISQLERGISKISLNDLRTLSKLFDVPIGFFLDHHNTSPADQGVVVRKENRRSVGTSEDGMTEELLSPDIAGSYELLLTRIEPKASLTQEVNRPTEETGYLLRGELDVWIDGTHFHLTQGDTFRIDHKPFRWSNPGTTVTEIVWVTAPPVF